MAATLHLLCSIDNAGYFESDISVHNPIRDELCDWKAEVDANGFARPPESRGLGVRVDEDMIREFPVVEGPATS
jgi:L-alanine-DL-glutamate epimerase-like enolase superfamily enzyme